MSDAKPSRLTLSGTARRGTRLAFLVLAITATAWAARGCARPAHPDRIREAAARIAHGRAHAWLSTFQAEHPRRGSPAKPASVAFVASAFAAAGLQDVRQESFQVLGELRLRNVIGCVPGTDRSRVVALVAHHDTVSAAPGAIDDGGAIAALIEASRALLAGPPPACDVWLVSFDGEERGCLGAKRHLEALGESGRTRLRAALAVELVGWTHDDLVVHTIPHGFAWDAEGISPAWVPDAVRSSASALGHHVEVGDPLISPFYQATIRVLGVQTGSDAGAYLEQGIPSAMLTGSALTNFYSGYHTPTDDMSRVDSARLDDAAAVIVGAALELSNQVAVEAPGRLGDAYLCLGPTTLDHAALIALALAAAVLAGLAGYDLRSRSPLTAVAVAVICAALLTLTFTGSVLVFVVGLPMACALGLAPQLTRGRRLLLVAGLVPFCVQALLIYVAGATFGFRWWGGTLETVGVAVLFGAYVVATQRLMNRAQQASPQEGE